MGALRFQKLPIEPAPISIRAGPIDIPIIKSSVNWWNTSHQPGSISRYGTSIHPRSEHCPTSLIGFLSVHHGVVGIKVGLRRAGTLDAKGYGSRSRDQSVSSRSEPLRTKASKVAGGSIIKNGLRWSEAFLTMLATAEYSGKTGRHFAESNALRGRFHLLSVSWNEVDPWSSGCLC
ncbi:hypothetical protein E3N88_44275 [Mikania micrantha]|uniref:Uncharacterized protein n=1 Tax=Mikania micrantha TaxID=192012 RepID=A0A5N6LCR2_9ASTR|nr:hypothetical protein E3N88_46117 [Mikania micrantha]KAD0429717.1 hypothetical protein E3N88_44275 [Mikania micrantha]